MSSINVDTLKSRLGGPPTLPSGVVVSAAATFSNDVSIGGTLTYEDVTNVDAVGLITARNGIKFGVAGVGGTIRANGDTTLAGVVTASQFVGDGSGLTNLVGTGVTNNVNTVNLNVISGISTFGGDVSIADKIIHTGDTNTALRFPAADTVTVETSGSERIRIDSSGNTLIGLTDASQSTQGGILQVKTSACIRRFVASAGSGAIRFEKTRSGSDGHTVVQDGDKLGELQFYGSDGDSYEIAGQISAQVDGTPGNGDMPGRLMFFTSADGTSNNTERLRIDSNGNIGVNCDAPTNITNSRGITLQGASGTPAGFINFMDSADNSDGRIVADDGILTITADFSDNTASSAIAFNVDGTSEKLRITSTGVVEVSGITSTASLTVGPGLIQEEFDSYASALTGTYNHDVVDHGMILYAYSNASASFVLNLRGDGSTTLNSLMNIGQSSVFTAYTGSNNTSYYMTDFQIDGSSQTEEWNGASAPSAGTGSGYDVYTFNILKTADATFKVFATFSNFN